MKILLSLLLIALIISCDPIASESENCHKFIYIKNHTSDTMRVAELGLHRDGIQCMLGLNRILPDSTLAVEEFWGCWEGVIENHYQGAVVFHFLKEFKGIGGECDSVELNQRVIERRAYTVEDLIALNWTIDYP